MPSFRLSIHSFFLFSFIFFFVQACPQSCNLCGCVDTDPDCAWYACCVSKFCFSPIFLNSFLTQRCLHRFEAVLTCFNPYKVKAQSSNLKKAQKPLNVPLNVFFNHICVFSYCHRYVEIAFCNDAELGEYVSGICPVACGVCDSSAGESYEGNTESGESAGAGAEQNAGTLCYKGDAGALLSYNNALHGNVLQCSDVLFEASIQVYGRNPL